MTPQVQALAFRIWRVASPLAWDVTATEIADAIGSTPQHVGAVCKAKGWGTRIRKRAFRINDAGANFHSHDFMVGELGDIFARGARLAEEVAE